MRAAERANFGPAPGISRKKCVCKAWRRKKAQKGRSLRRGQHRAHRRVHGRRRRPGESLYCCRSESSRTATIFPDPLDPKSTMDHTDGTDQYGMPRLGSIRAYPRNPWSEKSSRVWLQLRRSGPFRGQRIRSRLALISPERRIVRRVGRSGPTRAGRLRRCQRHAQR